MFGDRSDEGGSKILRVREGVSQIVKVIYFFRQSRFEKIRRLKCRCRRYYGKYIAEREKPCGFSYTETDDSAIMVNHCKNCILTGGEAIFAVKYLKKRKPFWQTHLINKYPPVVD